MDGYCLQSRRTGMYVVRQYDGRILLFRSRLRAWAFKTRRLKWHWQIVPAERAATGGGTVSGADAEPLPGDELTGR